MSRPEIRHENGKDLPASIERLEKRVARLRLLQSKILNEINKVGLEIDYLKKSQTHEVNFLRDIPELVWSRILALYQVKQNDLWSLSLASPDLEKRISRDGPVFKESCVMKKVMAVLTRRHYLNRIDLLNCLNSGSLELEDAAAQGWRFLKNKVEEIVGFYDSRAILTFMEDDNRQRNIWTAFVGKRFEFDAYKLKTFNERENFLATVNAFLQKYGRFVFFIEMRSNLWTEEQYRIDFLQRVFHTLPNIQYFQQGPYFSESVLSTSFDITNRRNVTSFFKVECEMRDFSFYKIFGPQCHTWRLDITEFPQFGFDCLRTEMHWKNVKVLELISTYFTPAEYETFQHTDFARLVSMKQLILHGGQDQLKTLTLVEKFPQVREVTLHCARINDGNLKQLPSCTFPFVKKLTVVIPSTGPPRIDQIANVLPSLRNVCFRAEITNSELQNWFEDWKNRDTFPNDTVDTYDLYAEGESLSASNIWKRMENLTTLVVESVGDWLEWESLPGRGMRRGGYTTKNEIYSRNREGNITLKRETVLDD